MDQHVSFKRVVCRCGTLPAVPLLRAQIGTVCTYIHTSCENRQVYAIASHDCSRPWWRWTVLYIHKSMEDGRSCQRSKLNTCRGRIPDRGPLPCMYPRSTCRGWMCNSGTESSLSSVEQQADRVCQSATVALLPAILPPSLDELSRIWKSGQRRVRDGYPS